MKPSNGSKATESSPASPATDCAFSPTQYFFPSWVSAVFYGSAWNMVKVGTFKEGVETDHGIAAVYEDPFDGELMFVMEPITGYRVKKPEVIEEPEPKATVTTMNEWKK